MKELIQQSFSQTQIDEHREKLDLFQKTVEEITAKLANITVKVQDKEAMQNSINEIESKVKSLTNKDDIEIITNNMQQLITSNKTTKARLEVIKEDVNEIIEQQLRIEEGKRTEKLKLFQETLAELTAKIENNTAINVKYKEEMQHSITEIVNKVETLINSSDIEIITTSIQELITSNKITKARIGVVDEDIEQIIEQQSKVSHDIIKVKLLEKIALAEAEKHYLKGMDYYYEQYYKKQEALECFNKAINLNPNHVKAYTEKGGVLMDLHQYTESLEYLEQAIKLDTSYIIAYYYKAALLSALNKKQDAEKCFNLAEKLTCNNEDNHYYLAKSAALTWLSRRQDALKVWDKLIELKPNDAFAYRQKGFTLYCLKRYKEALEACDQSIKLKPDYANAYSTKSTILGLLNRYKEALEACDQSIKLKPSAYFYYNKYINLFKLGCPTEAEIAKNKAIEFDKNVMEKARNSNMYVSTYIIDEIIYDKPLLNHPKLLQAAVNSKLSSDLIHEAINNNDEELILAGLISVGYDVGLIN